MSKYQTELTIKLKFDSEVNHTTNPLLKILESLGVNASDLDLDLVETCTLSVVPKNSEATDNGFGFQAIAEQTKGDS